MKRNGWIYTRTAAVGFALLLAMSAAPARAANTVVYRCLDSHLTVVYTDVPCKEGEAFDTRAGDADPAAVQRLEKMRESLDQSAAQRLAAERMAAQTAIPVPMRGDAAQDDPDGGYYTYPVAGYGYGYGPMGQHPLRDRNRVDHRHDGDRHGMHRSAPPPPYFIPRR
jgi:hypothetical protein